MTTATLAPPTLPTLTLGRITPQAYRWTVKEFHDANSRRVFGEGRRVMLIRGELLEQGPMNPLHAQGIRRITKVFNRIFLEGFFVQAQLPLVLGQDSDPFPDFAVIADDMERYGTIHPSTAVLVVEVADTSLHFDTTTKAQLYATANISEYWVVDLDNRRLIAYRNPAPIPDGGMAYRLQTHHVPGDSIAPLAKPDVSIAVAELLP